MKWRCGGTYMLVYTCRVCIEKKLEPKLEPELEPKLKAQTQ